jgi:hypothetical protein
MKDSYRELIQLLLLQTIVEKFQLHAYAKGDKTLYIYLKEVNSIPKEYRQSTLSFKGFFDELTVQDFPLRGKFVYRHIKRRRSTDKESQEIIQRDWNIIAQGTRMTQ